MKELHETTYRVYVIDVNPYKNLENYKSILNIVSKFNSKFLNISKNKEDILRSMMGELCVRYILVNDYDIYEYQQIYNNRFGKPFFSELPLFFNYSHSHDYVVTIVSHNQIGIDIEYLDTNKFDDIINHYFSLYDALRINNNCSYTRQEMFHILWTAKESIGKCIGCGLNKDILAISPVYVNKEFSIYNLKDENYFVYSSLFSNKYAFSLASVNNIKKVQIIDIVKDKFDRFIESLL